MADTYAVYAGVNLASLSLVASGISSLSLAIPSVWLINSLLSYNTIYYWRVDATNEFGTTTGDTWYFTSMIFAPPVAGSGVSINSINANKILVAASNNKMWYEV